MAGREMSVKYQNLHVNPPSVPAHCMIASSTYVLVVHSSDGSFYAVIYVNLRLFIAGKDIFKDLIARSLRMPTMIGDYRHIHSHHPGGRV